MRIVLASHRTKFSTVLKPPQGQVAAQAIGIERINAAADRLNAEAEDVLKYQAPWPDEE